MENKNTLPKWKNRLHEIIFEADTSAGKIFDVVLIVSILISVIIVMLDSVKSVSNEYTDLIFYSEWFFTILFSIEYFLRILIVDRPVKYIFSFYGIVDFISVVPTYLSLFFPGGQYFIVIRILRVLRIFRILKFAKYIKEASHLRVALIASRRKIVVFLFVVLSVVLIVGSSMYLIEGEENGFTSIPRSIYWAIVTLTTVGYGDISPQTGLGQAIASMIMILGYGIIAVPTGIVTAEISRTNISSVSTQVCKACSKEGHDADAVYCKYCGAKL
ncbi:MAG: ion transporter [Melioribacteraceae bacterium]|nr:ion transporter [Melioribacteraceae bacterium]